MSGHRFAPENDGIMDLGNAAEFYVDGLAYSTRINGLIRLGYYSIQPRVGGDGPPFRILQLKLVAPESVLGGATLATPDARSGWRGGRA